jgi:hypothetical protein
MTIQPAGDQPPEDAQNRWSTYMSVLLVEAAVIAGLWAFGLYFSS